jgi:hypothetical protein
MAMISTRIHAAGDYAGGALLLLVSSRLRDRRAAAVLGATGASTLATAALTDNELGVWRKLPMPVHLALDAATGAVVTSWAMRRRRTGTRAAGWVAQAAIGAGELALAALTDRRPSDDVGADGASHPTGMPTAVSGVSGEGVAVRQPGSGVPVAPAPVETPGPSVTPPAQPESDVERVERVDAALPAEGAGGETGDDLVAQQEAAAAAEAAAIGGPRSSPTGDPAMDPVYEAGGGEEEGFEAAEEELIENATHGDGRGDPARDAIAPEAEADRSTVTYGEGDQERKED